MSTSALTAWLEKIASQHTTEIELGLERINRVVAKLQLNCFDCPVITVAGTNGKGSTVSLIENTYVAAGYKVGAYYSPHLYHFCERIQLQGQPVSEQKVCDAFAEIAQHVTDIPVTFFEYITLAALLIFRDAGLDVLILEVGLGGRLDAVNCIDNDVAIITQIDYDHCDRLGDDLESIGREKAGIFRKNSPAICGQAQPPQTVIDAAQNLQCAYYEIGKDFHAEIQTDTWNWQSQLSCYTNLPKPKIHISNAQTALMALSLLTDRLPFARPALEASLQTTQLPGRWQIEQSICPIIYDVAHNPIACALLADKLGTHSGKTIAVFSALVDKDIPGMIKSVDKIMDEWHVIPILDTPRAADVAKIVQTITAICDQSCYNHATVDDLWAQLTENLQPEDRVVVFGSFHTVSAVKQAMRE